MSFFPKVFALELLSTVVMKIKQKSLYHAPESRQSCQNCYQLNMSKNVKLCHCHCKKTKVHQRVCCMLTRPARSAAGRSYEHDVVSAADYFCWRRGRRMPWWPVQRKPCQTATEATQTCLFDPTVSHKFSLVLSPRVTDSSDANCKQSMTRRRTYNWIVFWSILQSAHDMRSRLKSQTFLVFK